MLMYPDHLHNWLDFSHALFIFLILVPALTPFETGHIWGFLSIIWKTPWSKCQGGNQRHISDALHQAQSTLTWIFCINRQQCCCFKTRTSIAEVLKMYLMSDEVLSFFNALLWMSYFYTRRSSHHRWGYQCSISRFRCFGAHQSSPSRMQWSPQMEPGCGSPDFWLA